MEKEATKICNKCCIEKEISEFYRDNWHKNGLSSYCKECVKLAATIWGQLNPEKKKINNKKSYGKTIEKRKKTTQIYRANNKEKRNATNRRWRKNNPPTLKNKLNYSISRGMNGSLATGSKNHRHWETLVDFTIDQLKKHLERLFEPGMVWDNYGIYWEIDHKIPIAVFNYEKPEHEDFKRCWSLKNLQPLELSKNRAKGRKIEKPFQPSLML